METHSGYMAGMQKDFASCSMPYYATSSEEILFHVATRMTFKLDLKVSYGGWEGVGWWEEGGRGEERRGREREGRLG
jgi:TRAP-type C4-dicarboxylate transport system substrate-binding protein